MATTAKHAPKAASKTTAKSTSRSSTTTPHAPERRRTHGHDAIVLLKADHAEVKRCFHAYQKLVDQEADGDQRQAMAEQICMLLTVHATIEEEIFYPAAREVLGDDADLVDEADIEHASAKDLIAQIRGMQPEDDHYDAKVKVLGEYIDHHVEEEQDEMFPKVKKAGLNTQQIGERLMHRKQELIAEQTESAEAA